MDRLTGTSGRTHHGICCFADDIVLCRQNLGARGGPGDVGNALVRPESEPVCKTEYLRVGGSWEELKLQEEKVKSAKNFKYLGSTVGNDGRCEEEVRRRIQAGWMSWRKVFGVLCDS